MQLLRCFLLTLVVGCWGYSRSWAQSEAAVTSSFPSQSTLDTKVETAAIVEGNPVRWVYINSGTNRLGFVLPDNLRLSMSDYGKVQLVQTEMKYFLSIRILSETQPVSINQAETFRSLVSESFPGAELTSETTVVVLERDGKAYDLRWRSEGKTDRFVRVAYVSASFGILELSLVADLAAVNEGTLNLDGLMQQLKSNQGGKLVMAPVKSLSFN